MTVTNETRAHVRQTLGQLKHEIGAIQQVLEAAPEVYKEENNAYSMERKLAGYTVDEYLLKFRIGNVSDLAMHLLEFMKLENLTK